MIACTIGGVSVLVANAGFSLVDALENRSILTLTVLDSPGTANYTRGQPVSFSDSSTGLSYNGFVNTSAPTKLGIAGPFVAHVITTMDKQYLLDKRTNSTNFLNWYAGDIATNFVDSTLASEGVTAPYATHRDSTAANFNQGLLSGVVGTSNIGDGDLELLPSGSTVTISESVNADFATGFLNNTQAINNTLTPTTVSALKFQSTLSVPLVANFAYVKVWQGALTIGTNDTLNYDVWCASTSPGSAIAVDLTCSDGTLLHNVALLVDQNNLAVGPATDLSTYAKDRWYTRTIALTGLTGKTVNAVTIASAGTGAGTYTGYVKNCYLGSQVGSPFFGLTTTTPNVNPPLVVSYSGFSVTLTSVTAVNVWVPGNSYRISNGYTIDPVKLLGSSIVTWINGNVSGASVVLSASYDGGNTYAACTNNAALPALPAGSNVVGLTLTLKEALNTTGPDPTLLPTLNNVAITVNSAPKATKSDIVTSFYSAATWNAGTYNLLGLASDGVGITCVAPLTRNWSDLIVTGQSLFPNYANISESASTGAYVMTVPGTTASPVPQGQSRLDFAGSFVNFTLEVDLKFNQTTAGSQLGITYRQTYWDNANNTFGYYFGLANGEPSNQNLIFGYGSNSSTPAFTQLATATFTPVINTTYHVKIVVNGSSHQIYFNGAGTPTISVTDFNTLTTGYIGLRFFGAVTAATTFTYTFDNFVLDGVVANNGTWLSPSTSISSLVTCGPSAIAWTESNTSVSGVAGNSIAIVQTSIDGGATYQTCTNGGAIPNLLVGTTVTGLSLLTKISLSTTPGGFNPEVARLVWRVLGQYPGATGTRSTVPLGLDTATRANVGSGFGTGTDGQTYTQVGTATTNLTSNHLQIVNTTGNVFMIYGSRTGGDLEGTVRFTLSASGLPAGMVLRYLDTNNYYLFTASTTTLTLTRRIAGTSTTLQTASMALSTSTLYRMRFRVVGSGPVSVYGRVWASGSAESTSWSITAISA
jgi:hypothetical protein